MSNQTKKQLDDVSILRPFAILLLVVYHAFIIYRGGWRSPVNYEDVEVYRWIADISYSFMLQLFVMLSGYVFGFQRYELNRKFTLKDIIVSKVKRLIIPSIIFSIAYFIIFREYESFIATCIDILNGVGHMWFLPMLFWCFVGGYLIDKIKFNEIIKILFCALISIFSVFPIPFGINNAFSYIFFFYVGIVVYKNRSKLLCGNLFKKISITAILFITIFLLYEFTTTEVKSLDGTLGKIIYILYRKYAVLLYALLGSLSSWLIVNKYLKSDNSVSSWIIKLNGVCFGIYLFQQFILQYLFYKTDLPTVTNAYTLPWIACAITLLLSYVFTLLMLKTKVGRYLLG